MSLTLQSNSYSLQSVGYSPWDVKSSLHWELSEWWLLYIFNSVVTQFDCYKNACVKTESPTTGGNFVGEPPMDPVFNNFIY